MSRKHNTRHERGHSHYPERLKKRGVSTRDVRMEPLDVLRRRANYTPSVEETVFLTAIFEGKA